MRHSLRVEKKLGPKDGAPAIRTEKAPTGGAGGRNALHGVEAGREAWHPVVVANPYGAGAGTAVRLAGTICGWNGTPHGCGRHEHLQPMHVVVAVCLIISEGLDTNEVFEPPAFGIEKRPVDPEVMRVAMNIGDGFAEADHFVAQRNQESLEAVGLAVGLGKRLWVTQRRARSVGQYPSPGQLAR